jgi:histidine triad (HIT) family protein
MSEADRDCIFCKIVRGEIGTEFVGESEHAVAFHDLYPQAPTHVLVVSRRHYHDVTEIAGGDPMVAASMINLAVEVAQNDGVVERGFRILTNTGDDAGQTIHHLHFHVLGGKRLREGLA